MTAPALVLVSGTAGSGKSTMGRQVARRYGLPYLDYDSLVQPFLQGIARASGGEEPLELFYQKWRKESYDTLWNAVMDSLSLGVTVAASAPCSREWRQSSFFAGLRARYGVRFRAISIELLPDPGQLRRQLLDRGNPRDEGKLSNWTEYIQGMPGQAIWDADVRAVLRTYPVNATPEAVAALLSAAGVREREGIR